MKNILTRCKRGTPFHGATLVVVSGSTERTKRVGWHLSRCLRGVKGIGLMGALGAGKTQFVKGMAWGLGIEEDDVVSPSFGLINEYEGDKKLYHVDLYRLESASDIETLGIEDFFCGDGICVIEWAERLKGDSRFFLDVRVHFEITGPRSRVLTIEAEKGETIQALRESMKQNGEAAWR